MGLLSLAEVVGYGNTCDAYHDSTTSRRSGAIKAIKLALEEAEISPEQVAYVNAHGTSTPHTNEKGESGASWLFLVRKYLYHQQSFTGHLLGLQVQ